MAAKPWERYGGGAPAQGSVFTLPPDPYKQAEQRRKDEDQARQAAKEARDQAEYNATHNRDGTPKLAPEAAGNQNFNQAAKLRDDYNQNPDVKAYQNVVPILSGALQTSKNGQGDLSLIYSYAKIMDPTSVVRESETENAQNTSPFVEGTIQRLQGQLDGSGRLPQSVRNGLTQEMIKRTAGYRRAYETQRQRYIGDSQAFGLDPAQVVGPDVKAGFGSSLDDYDRANGLGKFASGAKPKTSQTEGGGFFGGTDQIGEDPRYKGMRFNGNGEPDPNGDFDAYGRYVQLEQDSKGGLVGRVTDFREQPRESIENWSNWTDSQGRTRAPDGSILSGWLGPATPPADPNADPYQEYLKGQLQKQGFDATSAGGYNERFNNGTLASFGDELAGAGGYLGGLVSGKDPGVSSALMRDIDLMKQQQMRDGQGWLGTAAELGGNLIPASLFPMGQGISGVAKGGALYGAADGFGRGNSLSDRLKGVAGGMLGGGVGGGVGGAAGKYAVAPLTRRLMNTGPGQKLAARFGAEPIPNPTPMENEFSKAGVDMGRVRGNIADAEGLGLPYALADADPRLQTLAGQVSRRSPDAFTTAKQYLQPRGLGQVDRLKQAIDTNLAPLTDVAARGKQLLQAGNTEASPYYEMSKSVAAPVDDELAAMLRTRSGQDALSRARSIMEDNGLDPMGKRVFFDKDGLIQVERKPAFETLDYIKKGFDAKIEDARNPVTGALDLEGNPQVRALNNLKNRLVGKLDQINPNYAQARATYAKFAQRKDALDIGYRLSKMLPRDADMFVSRLTPETMPEAQRGFGTDLADQAEKLRFTRNPYEAIYGSPAQQQRVGTMFPQGADKFRRIYDREQDMAGTMQEVLGGSQTAMRQGMDGAFGNGLTGPLEMVGTMSGAPGAATLATRAASFFASKGADKMKQATAEKMAPVLFANTADNNALGLIEQLLKNQTRRTNAASKATRRAGLFGAALVPATVN